MEKQPKFAVVTGASSGLGVDFAYQLALQGYSLFIAARRIEKLESVKKQIEATHNVKVVCVQCNLATSDGAQDLHQKVSDSGSPISVLINNAGLGTEGDFFEIDLEKNQQMTKVNIDAALELMWRFGNDMRKSGGGHILNVASFSAFQSPTSLATYAATKAFWLAHSQAMNAQRRESGVSVTATCPGFFKSEFFDKADVRANGLIRLLMMDSEVVARISLRAMFKQKSFVVPGFVYKVSLLGSRFLPRFLNTTVANFVMKSE